jgi:hypothetical protein
MLISKIAFDIFSRLFWDCKGMNLFDFCKLYFFIFSACIVSQNAPLFRLRAAKVRKVFNYANGLLQIVNSVLLTRCKSGLKISIFFDGNSQYP